MTQDKIDLLVDALRHSSPASARLKSLESQVWRSIHLRLADQPRNSLERWMVAIFTPENRLATVTAALAVGFFAAYVSVLSPTAAIAAPSLNLHVFASNYASPLNALVSP